MKILTAIYETDVFGTKAYHVKCFNCNWQSKRFDAEKTAKKHAEKHAATHFAK